jgi:hypothetical protein
VSVVHRRFGRASLLAVLSLLLALSALVVTPTPAQATTVAVFAGTGVDGYNGTNIQATTAKLWGPTQVAADSSGNVYIADTYNHIVRKVNTSGTISTVYGTAQTQKNVFNGGLIQPRGVTVTASGTVYLSDSLNSVIRNGSGSIVVGNDCGAGGYAGDGGPAHTAGPGGTGQSQCTPTTNNPVKLNQPAGLAYDDTTSTLYFADQYNCRVRQVFNGYINTVAGNGTCGYSSGEDGGAATSAKLNYPQAVAVRNGKLYIADTSNSRVRVVNLSTGVIDTYAGTGTANDTNDGQQATSAAVNAPKGVAVGAGGNVFIGTNGGNVRVVAAASHVISNVASVAGSIQGLGLDSQGNIYVSTGGTNHYVRKISGYWSAPKYYAVLGDSYSAGHGNPPFIPRSDVSGCNRSYQAYAMLLESYPSGSGMSLSPGGFVACSNAITSDVSNGMNGEPSQLNAINSSDELIILTIGGNDVGFPDYAHACVTGSCDANSDAYDDIQDAIRDVLPGNLADLYAEISNVAGSARVLVLGYPQLMALDEPTCEWLDTDEQTASRQVVIDLNSAISEAVVTAGEPFEYVTPETVIDNLRTGPFVGHELCTEDSYFNGLTVPFGYSYHPNEEGQAAYAELVSDYLANNP